jgi:hypothetical protein
MHTGGPRSKSGSGGSKAAISPAGIFYGPVDNRTAFEQRHELREPITADLCPPGAWKAAVEMEEMRVLKDLDAMEAQSETG